MPRHARIIVAGATVHLIQRGNNRAQCFFTTEDRQFYLFHLARLLPRAKCALHAFCLMTNHVHLLVTAHEIDSCATLMKSLGQLYAQYVNKTYGRTGALWEGRFKSCLVQSEHYVVTCYRYIELNPVRAGLFLDPHTEYLRLGSEPAERQAVYRDTFGTHDAARFDEIRQATIAGYVAGDDQYKRAIARVVGRRVERGEPGRPALPARDELNAELFPR
jgi:REP-associated tyrosine transposase